MSLETLDELEITVRKKKFAKYFRPAEVIEFLEAVSEISEVVAVHSDFKICRHPKDNKFLELAVDGHADLILTGDHDLLALHPFRGIAIVTPMQYLAED